MPIDVEKLNRAIIEKGLNYTDLAKKANISKSQISRIVNSDGSKSRTKTISKIANALGVDYKEICKEE